MDISAASALAKINTPKLSGIYPRERLFRTITSAMQQPLAWLHAPAGSGKTSLVTSYLDSCDKEAIWYQIDAGDFDPASFFYFLSLAAKKTLGRTKTDLPPFRPEYNNALSAYTRNFFRELYTRAKKGTLFVIDNYQDCPVDSPLHDALAQAFEEIPDGINLLIISRDEPPAPYARLRASGKIFLFNPQELALTLDESDAVCRSKLSERKTDCVIDSDQLRVAHELTQGWVTGLILMLEPTNGAHTPAHIEPGQNQVIFDYFAGEIFSRTNPVLRDFLLKTALLPLFTPEIAEAVTGVPKAARIINELIRRNFFIVRHQSPKIAYHYHPLFHEFLLERALDTLGKYEIIDIQTRAAHQLLSIGQTDAAISLFLKVQDWHTLTKIIDEQGEFMASVGRHQTLLDWLSNIPDNIITQTPRLQYWLGVSNLSRNLQKSRKYFIESYEHSKKSEQTDTMLLAWLGVVETYIVEWGNFKPLDRWIEELELFLAAGYQFSSPELEIRVAGGMFAALMYRQPHHPKLPEWESLVRNALPLIKNRYLQMKIGSALFFYYTVWTGDLSKASVIGKLLRPAENALLDPVIHTLWFALDGMFLWKSGDHGGCIAVIEKGLALAERSNFANWNMFLLSGGAYASLSLGNEPQVQQYLAKMNTALDANRLNDLVNYHYMISRIYLFRGKVHEALEHCEEGLRAATASGSPFGEALTRTVLAQILFQHKQREKAVAVNNMAREMATRMRTRNMLYIALMSEALFAFEMDSEKKAIAALKEALVIAREQDLIKHAFWWPPIMTRLCVKALEFNIETEFVQKVIRTRHLVPETPPLHLDLWPWLIKINTLGKFSVTVDGKPLGKSTSTGKKPFELLKVIIALGGQHIDQNKITEMLWPGAEGDSAAQSLHTTLHRLRKLLGDECISLQNGYLDLDARFVWVDVWACERLLAQLNKIVKLVTSKENSEQAVQLEQKLMNLYQGNFLENDTEQSWALALRQKIKTRFLTVLMELAAFWQKENSWDKALACYQRCLEIDSLSEEIYQRMMQAYQKTDRVPDALAIFQQCRKIFSDRLGTSPSAKTVAIYKSMNPQTYT